MNNITIDITPRNIDDNITIDFSTHVLDYNNIDTNLHIKHIKNVEIQNLIKFEYRITKNVYKGVCLTNNKEIAIKIYDKNKIVKNIQLIRIKREILILNLLRHEYICELHKIIESDEHIYICTIYYAVGDLFNYINNNKLTKDEHIRISYQIISCLNYIHKVGITHRDIKLENILLDDNLNIKLTDFGLSSKIDKNNISPVGTIEYASPEVRNRLNYRGDEIDIYSAGVTIFTMLKLKYPSCLSLECIKDEDFKFMLSCMLVYDPNIRYTSKSLLKLPIFSKYNNKCDTPTTYKYIKRQIKKIHMLSSFDCK